jgi:hypothetical protein
MRIELFWHKHWRQAGKLFQLLNWLSDTVFPPNKPMKQSYRAIIFLCDRHRINCFSFGIVVLTKKKGGSYKTCSDVFSIRVEKKHFKIVFFNCALLFGGPSSTVAPYNKLIYKMEIT